MANDNTTSNNELEEKKWVMSRIDKMHESIKDEIISIEKIFDDSARKELSRLRGWRNDVTYGLGILLTLLIGIKESNSNIDLLYWMIVTSIGIGISLIIFNSFIGRTERFFLQLIKQFTMAKGLVDWSNAFFTSRTRDMNSVNALYLKNYSEFTKSIGGISMIPILAGLINGKNKWWIKSDIRKEFNLFIKPMIGNIEAGKIGYNQIQKNNVDFPKTLIDYFEEELKEYETWRNNL